MKLNSEFRYIVTCIFNRNIIKRSECVVDTGAVYTCYKARYIDRHLKEKDMLGAKSMEIGGWVDGKNKENTIKIYKYTVDALRVDSVDLGKQDIWITFDERVSENVLGMDILQKLWFLQDAKEKELHFFKDKAELQNFINGGDIRRKVIRATKGYYIELNNMKCFFDNKIIKTDKYGRYVDINNNQKCYLVS